MDPRGDSASGSADYFDNVMTKFFVFNRTDTWKTDVHLFFKITNCRIVRSRSLHKLWIRVSVQLLTIKISQWAHENLCCYHKIFFRMRKYGEAVNSLDLPFSVYGYLLSPKLYISLMYTVILPWSMSVYILKVSSYRLWKVSGRKTWLLGRHRRKRMRFCESLLPVVEENFAKKTVSL